MYLVSSNEMREMDRLTIESFGLPSRLLMENAGKGATEILFSRFPDLSHQRVGIVAGKGNNGGDGFVIARYLAQRGIDVTVYLLGESHQVKGDAASNLELLVPLNIPLIQIPDRDSFLGHSVGMRHKGLWVDAIFGTGLHLDVTGYYKEIIDFINSLNRPVFSVDIPSGLNPDTGQICGTCIQADVTATFAFAKIGHLLYPGSGFTGELEIVDIGIPPFIADQVAPKQTLITEDAVGAILKPRSMDDHKGDTGHLLVIAGSAGKTGAAVMTALSAMRSGAGLVTLGIPESLNSTVEPQALEIMTCPLPDSGSGIITESALNAVAAIIPGKKCLAIGPGLGTAEGTIQLVCRLIQESRLPMVIDADGLNCLAKQTDILKRARAPVVLTPHPGEMGRLIGVFPKKIQKDRIGYARCFAQTYSVYLVLKGARTVVATPNGQVFINPTGNPGMASGGMGDVLTGVIAGLMTQGYSPQDSACAGVFLHGLAADMLLERRGPFGYLASEVMHAIPEQIRKVMVGTCSG
ncbi:MAG: NAD(P)H-hydrate dehydratase [Pseudomonadota bacterium]